MSFIARVLQNLRRPWKEQRPKITEGALSLLQSWIGLGEFGGNNTGWFVSYLTRGKDGSWCAALIYTALATSAAVQGTRVPFSRTHGARRLTRLIAKHGKEVDKLELTPGCVYCLPRGNQGWQGHVGMVERVIEPGVYSAIDGNIGRNAKVRRLKIDLRDKDVVQCALLDGFKIKTTHAVPLLSEPS